MIVAIAMAWAHIGPTERIESATAEIAQEPTVEALRDRAEAYAALGDVEAALDDLDAAALLGADVRLDRARLSGDVALLDGLDGFDALVLRGELSAGSAALQAYDAALAITVTVDVAMARGQVALQLDPADAARGYERALDAVGPSFVLQSAAVEAWDQAGELDRALEHLDALLASSASPDLLLRRHELTGDDDDAVAALALARERYETNPNDLRSDELQRALAAQPRGCGATMVGPWFLGLFLLGRRRCSC
ncbi:MAG: hypothetical protein GY913_15640 [Proteobacteria bacterium]|nr:hypothetical protein [Pseudomonadota bacterium]